ncbi:MAG: hypothetical protein IBX50_12005 [Marinospirillum sp.]|nr:hypothetical protein [Marinospirillum sp.]
MWAALVLSILIAVTATVFTGWQYLKLQDFQRSVAEPLSQMTDTLKGVEREVHLHYLAEQTWAHVIDLQIQAMERLAEVHHGKQAKAFASLANQLQVRKMRLTDRYEEMTYPSITSLAKGNVVRYNLKLLGQLLVDQVAEGRIDTGSIETLKSDIVIGADLVLAEAMLLQAGQHVSRKEYEEGLELIERLFIKLDEIQDLRNVSDIRTAAEEIFERCQKKLGYR